MEKKQIILIIVALIGINIYILINFYQFKNRATLVIEALNSDSKGILPLKVNLSAVIKNNNKQLNEAKVKDSLGNIHSLQNYFKQQQKRILVCRFSEYCCSSCVDYAIKYLLEKKDSIGQENILFLGGQTNNRLFNREKKLYGIHQMNVGNCTDLGLSIEKISYPYFLVIDSTLKVLNVFVPEKKNESFNNEYFDLILKRYFKR